LGSTLNNEHLSHPSPRPLTWSLPVDDEQHDEQIAANVQELQELARARLAELQRLLADVGKIVADTSKQQSLRMLKMELQVPQKSPAKRCRCCKRALLRPAGAGKEPCWCRKRALLGDRSHEQRYLQYKHPTKGPAKR